MRLQKSVWMALSTLINISLILSACAPGPVPDPLPERPEFSDIAISNLNRVTAPDVADVDLRKLVEGNQAFAFDFYQAVRDRDGNLFYSPYSISLALVMTYAGAKGETARQMAEALHFILAPDQLHPAFNALEWDLANRPEESGEGENKQPLVLNIVNSIWGQEGYPFLAEYLDTLALNYGAGLRLVDFVRDPEAARLAINRWVALQTKDRIKDLIPPGLIDPLTTLVLVNAIYFKASWLFQFEEQLTQDAPFTLLDGGQVEVPMMAFDQPKSLNYFKGANFNAAALPYQGGQTEMVILVPEQGSYLDVERSISPGEFEQVLAGMKSTVVDLRMPKFEFTNDFELTSVFQALGMQDAFQGGIADFSGIDGSRDLFISAILHKAFVGVDEQGTEAAAATAVIISRTSLVIAEEELIVDRPFLFFIRDVPTGTILFMGRVLNPVQ